MPAESDAESVRSEDEASWLQWGPYMSNREWGTVRESSAPEGANWKRVPYEQANQTAYRFGEDGIFGVCDSECRVCHSYAFWNYKDSHLKERFFGVTNQQGSNGEEVKELYFYKAADTQYRYLCAEYLYPQIEYPYDHLVNFEGALQAVSDLPHFDTNAPPSVVSLTDINDWYEDQRYFEIEFEMCKLAPDQIYFQLNVTNQGKQEAKIVVMPMLFLRNTWNPARINIEDIGVEKVIKVGDDCLIVCIKDPDGNVMNFRYNYDNQVAHPEILLTHNASKEGAVRNLSVDRLYCKDGFNRYIVSGDSSGLITNLDGSNSTKAGICYRLKLAPKKQVKLRSFLTFVSGSRIPEVNWPALTSTMEAMRIKQMVDSYQMLSSILVPTEQDILNAAYTTLLWNRQFYPIDRMTHQLQLSRGTEVLTRLVTVPDKWEQPYLASWDTAIHCLVLNCFDKQQALRELLLLICLIRADGSIFADEYRPDGVTPPVIILAAIDVFSKCTSLQKFNLGPRLYACLKRHLRWWLHRKDVHGVQLIDGGVCGVDYVSLFPRESLETGEGLIWGIFFLVRFLELTLTIYMTPSCHISSLIEADLPEFIRYLGRLCAVFVETVSQDNGLYHPAWLDVAAYNGGWCSSNPSGFVVVAADAPPAATAAQHAGGSTEGVRESFSSEDSDNPLGCWGPRTSCVSDTDSVDGVSLAGVFGESPTLTVKSAATAAAAAATDASQAPGGSGGNIISNEANTRGRQRCRWLHAYCYLPVICCCSLPNVPLQHSPAGKTLEELLATSFNGMSNWETRAPYIYTDKDHSRLFISVLSSLQLSELLEQLLSENQFLGQYGIRTMSMLHICDEAKARLQTASGTVTLQQKFCPGPSVSRSYGGNTNWYGAVNLPYNYLVIESLNKWATVLDKKFDLIEYPSYSGKFHRVREIVQELARRNVALFLPNANGIIPSTGDDAKRGLLMFETFDGDSGHGFGARHKGGWSAIIARTLLLMHNLEA